MLQYFGNTDRGRLTKYTPATIIKHITRIHNQESEFLYGTCTDSNTSHANDPITDLDKWMGVSEWNPVGMITWFYEWLKGKWNEGLIWTMDYDCDLSGTIKRCLRMEARWDEALEILLKSNGTEVYLGMRTMIAIRLAKWIKLIHIELSTRPWYLPIQIER